MFLVNNTYTCILPQNALRRDFNGKCIELIEGHYLEVVVEVFFVYFVSIPFTYNYVMHQSTLAIVSRHLMSSWLQRVKGCP